MPLGGLVELSWVPLLVLLRCCVCTMQKGRSGQDRAEHGASGLEGDSLSASLAHASLQIYYQKYTSSAPCCPAR